MITHDVRLPGCLASSLGAYLKALAVHRLVAEQRDPTATSHWDPDGVFHLHSVLDAVAVTDFFVNAYVPTPIVTPWNGGSGFFPKDQQAGVRAIEQSTEPRFASYRDTIRISRAVLEELDLTEKPDKERKQQLLEQLRTRLPDEAVTWLDAAYVVTDQPRYPPILGTGGNDGRLDFGNNFLQRIADLLLTEKRTHGRASVAERLRASLLGEVTAATCDPSAAGQYAPGRAGGVNMTTGLDADPRVNPWDFVLALEGTITFAGAAVRRLDTGRYGNASFPFHVNSSSVGYGASASLDKGSARAELWLPLWSSPTTFAELRALFAEGRLEWHGQRARTGLDAVRALASLGVDRGVDRFERIGLLRRNGLAYLASALGAFPVRRVARVDLLRELDPFMAEAERLDRPAPFVLAALRQLQAAVFDASRAERPLTGVLAATGALERAVAKSVKTRDAMHPARRLSDEWYAAADDASPEFAVASAVASWGIREALEPIDARTLRWTEAHPVWTDRSALENVIALARRRIVAADAGKVPLGGRPSVSGRALATLLNGGLDEARLAALLFGLALLNPRLTCRPGSPEGSDAILPWFGVLRAVSSPRVLAVEGRHPSPPAIIAMLARLDAHDLPGALQLAEHRLRGSGRDLRGPIRTTSRSVPYAAIAAALVIPLPYALEDRLVARVVRSSFLLPVEVEEVSRA